eukprot:12520868-Alexandrium_andersonii.AAC.1
MTQPEPLDLEGPGADSALLARRFSREQGVKPDGSLKLRAVDDMSGSGVNAACQPAERLHYDTVDQLVRCVCELAADGEAAPAIWKADIDSAYRR